QQLRCAVTRRNLISGVGVHGSPFAQMAARAGDRKTLVVEETLDLENEVDVFLPVKTMTAGTLDRLEHGEFGFPVTQNERLDRGDFADIADAVELTLCLGRCAVARHFSCVPLKGRCDFSRLKVGEIGVAMYGRIEHEVDVEVLRASSWMPSG